MWHFANPHYLYALCLPAGALALYMWRYRQHARQRIGQPELVRAMTRPSAGRLPEHMNARLWLAAMCCLVLALAEPQRLAPASTEKRPAINAVLAMDISLSMLCRDTPPNRLEQARQAGLALTHALQGNRLGVVLFAGEAYLQMPLTTDWEAVALGIRTANPDMAPSPGTAVGAAIALGQKLLASEVDAGKLLILITDGESHDQDALAQAKAAHKNGLTLCSVGVGTTQGGLIPIQVAEQEEVKRDERGEPVRTRLNESLLQQIANAGGGRHFRWSSQNVDYIATEISRMANFMQQQMLKQPRYAVVRSYYQWMIGLALVLMAVATWSDWKRRAAK